MSIRTRLTLWDVGTIAAPKLGAGVIFETADLRAARIYLHGRRLAREWDRLTAWQEEIVKTVEYYLECRQRTARSRPIDVGDRVVGRYRGSRGLCGRVVGVDRDVFGQRAAEVAWDHDSEQLCLTSDLRRICVNEGQR